MILWTHLVGELGEMDLHPPADIFPVLAGVSELQRLGTFPAIRLSESYRQNAGVHKGKDQIAGSDFAH